MASQQPPIKIEDLRVDPRRARTQNILRRLFFMSAALAILITVMSYNLLGEGIREAIDPRLKE